MEKKTKQPYVIPTSLPLKPSKNPMSAFTAGFGQASSHLSQVQFLGIFSYPAKDPWPGSPGIIVSQEYTGSFKELSGSVLKANVMILRP
jgi:hypothetical protein